LPDPRVRSWAGGTLAAIQRADLFGDRADEEMQRLVAAVRRILGDNAATSAPGIAGTAPASRPGAGPAQLPRVPADFTGSAGDLQLLRALLEERDLAVPDAIVISAVAGQGGVGKTTLAVHVAHQCKSAFPDGQLYVDLRGMGSVMEALNPGEVLGDFLRALGVDSANVPDSLDARAAMFRSRMDGRRALILLDNAADESQVEALLP
jgi:hypothetical protein